MILVSLILYGAVNVAMVLSCLLKKGRIYEFPLWFGMLSLGFLFPQAIGGFINHEQFPDGSYASGMLFATLCNVALWVGYRKAVRQPSAEPLWLTASFDARKLYWIGAGLCLFGFYFQYKLSTLSEEVLAMSQWSGAAVQYIFFASVFEFGFIALWMMYLSGKRTVVPKYLIFVIPGLLLMLRTVVLAGRRQPMMDLGAYIFISLWFVRRIAVPRVVLITGLAGGLILINAIGTYRSIMAQEDLTLSERLAEASRADYADTTQNSIEESGVEFNNYIVYRQVYEDDAGQNAKIKCNSHKFL